MSAIPKLITFGAFRGAAMVQAVQDNSVTLGPTEALNQFCAIARCAAWISILA